MRFISHLISIFILLTGATVSFAQISLQDSVNRVTANLLTHPKSKGLLLNQCLSVFDIGSHGMNRLPSFCSADSLDYFMRAIAKMGSKEAAFPAEWAQKMRDYHYYQKSTSIPIVSVFLSVDRIRPEALSNQKLVLHDRQLKLKSEWEDAMESDTLVWISPLVPSIEHPTHTSIRFDSLHWISNGIQVSELKWRKLHDHAWSPVKWNQDMEFPSVNGRVDTLELEVRMNNRVKILRFPVARTWNQVPNEHVKQWMIQATSFVRTDQVITGYQFQTITTGLMSYQISIPIVQQVPKLNRALISVDYVDQSPNPVLRKPFVIVEGIDFGYKERPTGCAYGRCGSLGYFEFINARKRDYNPNNPDEILPEFFLARTFKDSLRRVGYDVVFVDFENGFDYIQDNAMVLVEVLRQLKQQMAGNDGIVVCGASMGGLVARYALTWMENRNEKHCVREFISFDSPQEGANVPLAIQEFADYTARHNFLDFFHKSVDSRDRKFNAPASRQMMLTNYEMPFGQPHPLRTQFMQELQALGNYPQQLRKTAIANGTLTGTSLPMGIGSNILNLHITPSNWMSIASSLSLNPLTVMWTQLFGPMFLDYRAQLYALCGYNGLVFQGDALMPGNLEYVLATGYCDPYDNLAGGIGFHGITEPLPWLNLMQIFHPSYCLIPSSSALGLVPNGVNPVMNSISFNPGSGIPFDLYWSAITNEKHVQISHTMIDFILARLRETSQQVLTSLTLPVVQSLNLGQHSLSKINTSFEVPSGKQLTFNHGPMKMGDGSTLSPTTGSLISFEIGSCEPVIGRVMPGGRMILGHNNWNNAGSLGCTVRVKAGSTLWIEGELRLEGKSILVIEPGATLRISPNNLIELASQACKLEILGQLVLDPSATFKPEITGVLEIGEHASVLANSSGHITLEGTANWPARVVLQPRSQWIIPVDVARFNMVNCEMVFHPGANLNIETHAEFFQAYSKANSFSGPQSNSILLNLDKTNHLVASKFEYLKHGIKATGNGNAIDLVGSRCEFLNCEVGVYQKGGGLKLNDCGFYRNSQAILALEMERNSTILGSNIEQNVGGILFESPRLAHLEVSRTRLVNQMVYGIQLENCSASIYNSLFERTGVTAIFLSNAPLRLTCSQFVRNAQAIELDLGAELDISDHAANVFRNNESVFLFNFSDPRQPEKLIWIKGKNDIRWNNQIISGLFDAQAIAYLPGSVQFAPSRIGPLEFFSVDPQENLFNAPHPTTSNQLYWNVMGNYLHPMGRHLPILVEPLGQLAEPFSCGDKLAAGDDAPIELNPTEFSVSNRPFNLSTSVKREVNDWQVFPNPATQGWIEVKLPEFAAEEEVDLELVDFTGKRIRQWADRQGGNWRLEVSGLASGWYQLRVLSEHHTFPVRKVLIQNGL